jgi:hypothetical protein
MRFFRRLKTIPLVILLFSGYLGAKEYPPTGIPQLPGDPSLNAFPVCYKHTCEKVATVSLNPNEWDEIRSIFQPGANSPKNERLLIKKAIAKLEVIVGKKVNTLSDKGKNMDGMFVHDGYQMDCIDESSNTTTYLALMQKDGLLKWHTVQPTKTRGFFIFGLPHTTAVIKEKQSKNKWAVDSWFHDNGVEPEILPVSIWSDGWDPEDEKQPN